MKKLSILAATALAIGVGCIVAATQFPRFKRIEKRGPRTLTPVIATLPVHVEATIGAIRSTFNVWADFVAAGSPGTYRNKFPHGSKWEGLFLYSAADADNRVFPSDAEIQANAGPDRFIARYISLSTQSRKDDFYLYEPTAEEYWASEYYDRGSPAKFRCSFILHMESVDDSRTRLEVFEYLPTIWAGEKLGFPHDAVLPGMVNDIRAVEPTTVDRLEVLRMVDATARSRKN